MDENAQEPTPDRLTRFISRQEKKRHLAAEWARLAGLRAGMVVLDIGSGPGALAAQYAAMVGEAGVVYALDPHVAPHWPAPNLVHLAQDATLGIIVPSTPDVIFLTDTLHHAADPAAILAHVRAVCGPASRVLIAEYDPAEAGLVGAKPARRMRRETLLALLAVAGFSHGGIIAAPDEHYALLARPA
jgi:ubiquinone/menaquinone biosynthesis C-methylase UbiE